MSGVMSYLDKQKLAFENQNPYQPIDPNQIQLHQNPYGFAKLWNEPLVKNQLKESIQQKISQGKLPQHKAINEKMLIQEYWCQWLNLDEKDFQNQLQKHPGLIQKDHEDITNIITVERARQFYWSCGMSVFTYGVYHLALKKKATFYNFFRKKSQYRIVNYSKMFVGGITLLWSWIITLNYFYNQKIPTDLAKKGYFKNYKIMFEQVYV